MEPKVHYYEIAGVLDFIHCPDGRCVIHHRQNPIESTCSLLCLKEPITSPEAHGSIVG
jgi:hypothetical protein